jgi:5-methylcytosine-specific restriction endonuclease McrA
VKKSKQKKKSETFDEERRKEIWIFYRRKCANCREKNGLSIHHLVANTKPNRKKYGNEKIQSIENGILCCQGCHDNWTLWALEMRKKLQEQWQVQI